MMMNREKKRKRKIQTDEAIHIVALWNLMLILIPFLLLSAAFSKTSILNLMIPSSSAAPAGKPADKTPKQPVELSIQNNGITLHHGLSWTKFISLKIKQPEYDALDSALQELKKENPNEERVLLSSSPYVPYEVIVQVMDRCRGAQFPDISLAAGTPAEE